MKKKRQRFLRTDSHKYSRLGIRRKKKQVYRRAKGGENKIRLKMKGHLRNVSIGFRSPKKERYLVKGLNPLIVFNVRDLEKIGKSDIGIIAKIGAKKRKEILDYAIKHNVLLNIDPQKNIEKIEAKLNQKKQKRTEREKKKLEQDKKAKKAAEKKAKGEIKQIKDKDKDNHETNEEVIKTETDIKENVEEKK